MSRRSFPEVESDNLKICKKKEEEEWLEVQQQIEIRWLNSQLPTRLTMTTTNNNSNNQKNTNNAATNIIPQVWSFRSCESGQCLVQVATSFCFWQKWMLIKRMKPWWCWCSKTPTSVTRVSFLFQRNVKLGELMQFAQAETNSTTWLQPTKTYFRGTWSHHSWHFPWNFRSDSFMNQKRQVFLGWTKSYCLQRWLFLLEVG